MFYNFFERNKLLKLDSHIHIFYFHFRPSINKLDEHIYIFRCPMFLTLAMSTNLCKCCFRCLWQSACLIGNNTLSVHRHRLCLPSRLPPKSMYPSHSPTLYLCCLQTTMLNFPHLLSTLCTSLNHNELYTYPILPTSPHGYS